MTLETMKQQTLARCVLAGLALLLIIGLNHQVQGGCSRYGHSCFGAHGKRMDPAGVSGSLDYNGPSGQESVGYGQPLKSDSPASYQVPSRVYGPNRMSPYLFEWALAAQRAADLRPKDDNTLDMRRKK